MAGLPLTVVLYERGGEFFGVNNLGFCMHQQIKEHKSTAKRNFNIYILEVSHSLNF